MEKKDRLKKVFGVHINGKTEFILTNVENSKEFEEIVHFYNKLKGDRHFTFIEYLIARGFTAELIDGVYIGFKINGEPQDGE